MSAVDYLALAVLILLLLPVVVLPWEGRRAPDVLYAAIGAGGIAATGLRAGWEAMPWAAAAGLACLIIVSIIVTNIRIFLDLQILTSGHIKLLAAGSTWLGLGGALAMVSAAFVALLAAAAWQQRRSGSRPDFTAIAALAILCVGIQQAMPNGAPIARATTSAR